MNYWLTGGFVLLVISLLALDLGVFNRKAHVVRSREALAFTAFYFALAMAFNVAIYFIYKHHWLGMGLQPHHTQSGHQAALDFLTGYIVELSLSMDNIFVIALIFAYFRVPDQYQHRVLFWGVLGAVIMRAVMIGAGVILIQKFFWMIYVFGALLIFTAIKMLRAQEESVEPERNPLVRLARRLYRITPDFHAQRFFVKLDGKTAATPMFLVLLVVESTDVLFAIDSIPAIFAVTSDPFLVFTSNIFAILGLRSLYFALAGLMRQFRFLKISLVFLLIYVGVKMLLSHHYPIPTPVSLGVICGTLAVGVVASALSRNRIPHAREEGH